MNKYIRVTFSKNQKAVLKNILDALDREQDIFSPAKSDYFKFGFLKQGLLEIIDSEFMVLIK